MFQTSLPERDFCTRAASNGLRQAASAVARSKACALDFARESADGEKRQRVLGGLIGKEVAFDRRERQFASREGRLRRR